MWNQVAAWFFAREDARTAAAIRIGFCVTWLLVLWDFHPAMPLLFGERGLFGTIEPLPYALSGWRALLFQFDRPGSLETWFALSVTAAISGAFGFLTRPALVLTFYSMLLFRERGPYITFGADLVLNCICVLLLFSDCGAVWSLDRLRKRRVTASPMLIENWPVKAICVQVALIYLVTGLKKLGTTAWQDGSAVYYAIQVGNVLKGMQPTYLLRQHTLMAALTYGTLIFEIGFPFFVFPKQTRWLALMGGIALHSGIDCLMSIRFFSLAMYVGYLAFLTSHDWDKLAQLLSVASQNFGHLSPGLRAARPNLEVTSTHITREWQ